MMKNFKEEKYFSVITYYFLGIILAVIIFQFTINLLHNNGLDIVAMEKDILKYSILSLVGGFVGGAIYILLTFNKQDRKIQEEKLWLKIKENRMMFFLRNIIAFSLGGFVYMLGINLFEVPDYNHILQFLFSENFIIDYIGIILAMIVFSLSFSIGIRKRLNLLFDN